MSTLTRAEAAGLAMRPPPLRMSFSMTEPQFLDGSKDVTRRLGWRKATAGTRALAVRKCMGLKKGEKQVVIGAIEIVSSRWERLDAIDEDECRREGFPTMTPAAFVEFFCKSHHGCKPSTLVNRIEFRRI
jgi:hypothetical protein